MTKDLEISFEEYLTGCFNQTLEEGNALSHVPEEKIQEIYALAYVLYNKKLYQESSHYFRLLTIFRSGNSKYWKGLGACLQLLRDYEAAINCYLYCQELSEQYRKDPYHLLHIADCYFTQKKAKEGLDVLEAAASLDNATHDASILHHIELMKQVWSYNCH